MTFLSWLAVTFGFAGTWIAGRHRTGWLVGASSAAMWLVYDIDRSIPAGAFAAAVAIVLSIRNFRIGRRRVMKPELTDGPDLSKRDRKELLRLLLNVRRKREKAVKHNDRETR